MAMSHTQMEHVRALQPAMSANQVMSCLLRLLESVGLMGSGVLGWPTAHEVLYSRLLQHVVLVTTEQAVRSFTYCNSTL